MESCLIKSYIPEIFLTFVILNLLVLNTLIINNIKFNYPILSKELFFQCFFVLLCLLILVLNNKIEGYFIYSSFLNDLSTKTIKILILTSSICILFFIVCGFITQKLNFFEYFIIFLISLLAGLLLVSTCDILPTYLILEMQTLTFYILSSFKRNSAFSSEAGLKYFISGSFISGIFLISSSLIYGLFGTLNFNNLILLYSFKVNGFNTLLLMCVFLMTFVFLFKISIVPFHLWSPDVYEGSPISSTIIFSIIPKISLFYLFFKWLLIIAIFESISTLLVFCGILSIFFGSFFALRQKKFKRLIIFSSISQVGFIVSGLSIANICSNAFLCVFFFIIIYIITTTLVWSNIIMLSNFKNKINEFKGLKISPLYINNVSSLFFFNKTWSFSNLLIFFSLAGIPPLVGFSAKILIISSLNEAQNFYSSTILFIVSTLSVFYYLRIIKIIFFENNIVANSDFSQIVVKTYFLESECLCFSFFLFFLLFLFFYPAIVLNVLYYINFNFTFF